MSVTVVRNGSVVTIDGLARTDIRIVNGVIAELGAALEGDDVIEATLTAIVLPDSVGANKTRALTWLQVVMRKTEPINAVVCSTRENGECDSANLEGTARKFRPSALAAWA